MTGGERVSNAESVSMAWRHRNNIPIDLIVMYAVKPPDACVVGCTAYRASWVKRWWLLKFTLQVQMTRLCQNSKLRKCLFWIYATQKVKESTITYHWPSLPGIFRNGWSGKFLFFHFIGYVTWQPPLEPLRCWNDCFPRRSGARKINQFDIRILIRCVSGTT